MQEQLQMNTHDPSTNKQCLFHILPYGCIGTTLAHSAKHGTFRVPFVQSDDALRT